MVNSAYSFDIKIVLFFVESNLTEVLAMVKKAEEAEDALKQCESLELKVSCLFCDSRFCV